MNQKPTAPFDTASALGILLSAYATLDELLDSVVSANVTGGLSEHEKKIQQESNAVRDGILAQLAANLRTDGLHAFTVIGHDANTRELRFWCVEARDGFHAFAVVAETNEDVEFSAAIPGHLSQDDDGITFPGEALVSDETVREQPDVFHAE